MWTWMMIVGIIGIIAWGYWMFSSVTEEEKDIHPCAYRVSVWQRMAGLEGKANSKWVAATIRIAEKKNLVRGIDKDGYRHFESVNNDREVLDFLIERYDKHLNDLLDGNIPGTPWEENYVAIQKLKENV